MYLATRTSCTSLVPLVTCSFLLPDAVLQGLHYEWCGIAMRAQRGSTEGRILMTPIVQCPPTNPSRRHSRRRARYLALFPLTAAAALVLQGSAVGATRPRTVAFVGHYKGTAALLINNGTATISSVHGSGTGTASLVGKSTIRGSGRAGASALCDPFSGKGAILGTGGTIRFAVANSTSKGCSSGESGPVTVTFKGVAKAIGGTGKDKGASGSLVFAGTMKLGGTSGSQSGTFTVTLHGRLSFR